MSDLVYELRIANGAEKIQELEEENRRLHERIGRQEQEVRELKEKVRNGSDGVNGYGEDLVEYFSRLINAKD